MRRASLECVYELAKIDKRVVFVGSDLGPDVLADMKHDMPDRWFMEGVAEQSIIGLAAGLALEGFIPYVNTIATFLTRRCFEQIVLDLCLHNLPVRLIANGGGVVYAPLGPTHLAIEDMAILRCIPNMTVLAPCDAEEMRRLMPKTLDWPGPMYLRLAKGGDSIVSREKPELEIGKGVLLREPQDVLFVTTGIMTQRALTASDSLSGHGINSGVLHFHTIKPLDEQLLIEMSSKVQLIVTVEEHVLAGGLGSLVLETLNTFGLDRKPNVVRLGIPDSFAENYGSQDSLLKIWKLDPPSLVAKVIEVLNDERE